MDEEIRRPRPGYISGADDMLDDMDEIDRQGQDKLTPYKTDSIKMYLRLKITDKDFLAKNFSVGIEDVETVIAEFEQEKLA